MARDDYHVIVYQILAYLYVQLKMGEKVDGTMLQHNSPYLDINNNYWKYIIENMILQGLISGVTIEKAWGKETTVCHLEDAQITPSGIEYLCDNSFLEKAKTFLKDIKAVVSFV